MSTASFAFIEELHNCNISHSISQKVARICYNETEFEPGGLVMYRCDILYSTIIIATHQ